jgi:predicted nucleotidyltransferase
MMDRFAEIKKKIIPLILPFGASRIAIFGSFVRGEESSKSDIDLLVTLKPRGQRPPAGLKWFGLEDELSRVLGRKVDLISEKALSPYIRPYIEKEMVILYDEG